MNLQTGQRTFSARRKRWTKTWFLMMMLVIASASDAILNDENAKSREGNEIPVKEDVLKTEKEEPIAMEDDDRTLLDMFGEIAKEYLTQRAIPDTDAECRWDWRYARCEPFCDCAFTPRFGDYHLGRSCRLAVEKEKEEVCHLPPATPYSRIATKAMIRSRLAYHKTKLALLQVAIGSFQKWEQIHENTCSCNNERAVNDTNGRLSTIKERILCGGPAEKRCNHESNNFMDFRNRSSDDNNQNTNTDSITGDINIGNRLREAEDAPVSEESFQENAEEKLGRAKWIWD